MESVGGSTVVRLVVVDCLYSNVMRWWGAGQAARKKQTIEVVNRTDETRISTSRLMIFA